MIIDAAIVVFVGFFVRRGMRRGIVASLAGLAGFVAAAAAAVFCYGIAAGPVARATGLSRGTANLAAALAIFVVVTLGAWTAGRVLRGMLRRTKWGLADAAAGGAIGGAWALSWVAIVLTAITVAPVAGPLPREVRRSTLARAIAGTAPRVVTAAGRADLRRLVLGLR